MKTAMKSTINRRPYQRHGLTTLQAALKSTGTEDGWVDRLGEVGLELREWRSALINDLGGEQAISAMQRSIIDLATSTHVLISSIDKFMLEQPCIVNRSKRALFPVVVQRQTLADSLARYMGQLGLGRRARPAMTLAELLQRPSPSPSPSPEAMEVPHVDPS